MEKHPEYDHIALNDGKIYCNICGDWDWLKHHQVFVESHKNCIHNSINDEVLYDN